MKATEIAVPFFVWPLALVAGILIAGGSLSYSPEGRINVLWVWLIWAGLPALGSVAALLFALGGSHKPWLFKWRDSSVRWYPNRRQRLHMLWLLQVVWCLVALGMLLGYLTLLLFSDLAFGWSSTLINDASWFSRAMQWLASPWAAIWPTAVPSIDLVLATHFQRINPGAADPAFAGQWWQFLMASLLFYNLLPRMLLALIFYVRWRRAGPQLSIRGAEAKTLRNGQEKSLTTDVLEHWHQATRVTWELEDPTATTAFGLASWAEDEQRLAKLLADSPSQLLWQVDAVRSPVGELADLVARARAGGIRDQALWARPTADTQPERHLASWRAFAQHHQLVWISNDE